MAASRPSQKRAAPPARAPQAPPAGSGPKVAQVEVGHSLSGARLDDRAIEATAQKYAASFEACVADARQNEPGIALGGRRVVVTMTVNPDGRSAYPTLDDVELNGTELGKCLKRQSGKMVFPAFAGEPIRARVPLTLR